MEEKERYEYFFGTNTIKDNKTNQFYGCAVDLLNQQSKRIKELEQEIQQLKQQLHDLPKKIVEEIRDCLLDVSNGWWRYFMTDGCEYLLLSDLQGCLDETIDTILKKYGGEDEQNIGKS